MCKVRPVNMQLNCIFVLTFIFDDVNMTTRELREDLIGDRHKAILVC